MNHLTPDELLDAMDSVLAPDRHAHLSTCDACRRQLAELSAVVDEAKQVSVPEPAPVFWQQLSKRIGAAIDDDAGTGSSWRAWLRWQLLLPAGAAAVLVLALLMPKQPLPLPTNPADAHDAADMAPHSESWSTVAELVGDIDLEAAAEAGVVQPGITEQAVLELTADEQQELTRLLRAELTRAKS